MTQHTKDKILRLVETGSAVIGLRLCFHDRTRQAGLPRGWTSHPLPHCAAQKHDGMVSCGGFDLNEVPRALAGNPEGRIHTCPHGYTEIAVPVFSGGMSAGILFAGQCWVSERPPPYPSLIVPPGRQWLEDRHMMVKAIATELGRLLQGEEDTLPDDRRRAILVFLDESMNRMVGLADVAEVIGLSKSRTSHVVRDLFGSTLPELVNSVKLEEAARLLTSTEHPIGDISQLVGYDDQNYFSRIFSTRYGLSPRAYRKRYRALV